MVVLASCQTKKNNHVTAPIAISQTSEITPKASQTPMPIEITPTLMPIENTPTVLQTFTPAATETFIAYGCQEPGYPAIIQYANNDGFGDRYIARIPIETTIGKNYEEIVQFLVTKWLEHYKTESASVSASIKDFEVGDISLVDPSCDPFFKIVAWVRFSIIPAQVPHDMASFPGDLIKDGDVWWHLSMPVGVFIDDSDYRLRLVFGWGT